MKSSLKNILITLVIQLSILTGICAQQLPGYTQYMYNLMPLNPAYTGYELHPNFFLSSRWQWVGIEGAPSTAVFSSSGRLTNHSNSGVGMNIYFDKVGVTTTSGVYATYAYKINSKNRNSYTNWEFYETTISLGIVGGFDIYEEDVESINYNNDPEFSGNYSAFVPNFGFGVFVSKRNFFLGISAPKLLGSFLSLSRELSIEIRNHLFFTLGKVIRLQDSFKLKPSLLIKYVAGAPMQLDLNMNALFSETVEIGLAYRSKSSINITTLLYTNRNLAIGYSYDIGIGETVSLSSHELMIKYRFISNKQ